MTLRSVLADTGPLYALATPSDQFHKRAYEEAAQLQRERLNVVTPYPTLFETYGLLLRRVAPVTAHLWLSETRQQIALLSPEAEDYRYAASKVVTYVDQSISLFDGLLAVLSERLDFPIWTFDADFDIMRVHVWR